MERGFYNDDFEQLIRQKADQYKMFPSDNVWKGIHRSLHTRRKWYGLGLLLFLAGISYLASLQLMAPSGTKKIQTHIPASKLNGNAGIIASNTITGPVAANANQPGTGHNNNGFSVFNSTYNNSGNNSGNTIPATETVSGFNPESELPHTIVITELPEQTIVDEIYVGQPRKNPLARNNPPALIPFFPGQAEEAPAAGLALVTDGATIEVGSHEVKRLPNSTAVNPQRSGKAEDEKRINWLQEYAVYELTPPPMRRWAWQIAFSPTMNYRRLTSSMNMNDQINVKGLPAGAIEGKPETLVSHQPALGFGLGSSLVYTINKNMRFRVGIDFRYQRYGIKAYAAPVPETGKIQLDVAGKQPDSLTALTRLRNFSGSKAEDIQNQYFQLAAPIGLEVTLLGTEKLQLNVAGTLQPTYLLNRNSYLITTDFKNYMRAPSLVRRWNVNAGAEIFLSYKTGDLKWQLGPEFRYQMMSTYAKEYPIREYLMEYGVKIGVTKTIR